MTSVNFSNGLPETVLPADPLDTSLEGGTAGYEAVGKLVASHPKSLIGWATLADLAPDTPVRCVLHKADGTDVEFEANQTFSPEQLEWVRAGSALNIIRARGES